MAELADKVSIGEVVDNDEIFLTNVGEELEQRFDYKPVLPLDVEMTAGKNWLDQDDIPLD